VRKVVVADAGPLIGLARIGHLSLLQGLYNSIAITPAVLDELKISADRPGAKAVSEAINAGWIRVIELKSPEDVRFLRLLALVDAGEAESIRLASEQNARLLIIDDRKGRKAAKSHGVPVIGTGGILVSAKRIGLLSEVSPILDDLARVGYRLSPGLRQRILELANEDGSKMFQASPSSAPL
jgi:predicted nucleic acid-binding protein